VILVALEDIVATSSRICLLWLWPGACPIAGLLFTWRVELEQRPL